MTFIKKNPAKFLGTILLISCMGLSTQAMGERPENKNAKSSSPAATRNGSAFKTTAILGREGFSKIVEPLLPAVVNISTTKELKMPDMQSPDIPNDSPLGEFFRHFFKEYNKRMRPQKSRSLGSGFVVSYDKSKKEAYIVTNNHIIVEADEIVIRLADEDKTEIKAEVVGMDERTDIALLKVKMTKVPAVVEWGDSAEVKVGEWSIAIGNPFGLGSTVTAGIISTKGRELPIGEYVEGYIQTDASINMGNSGGPLFNLDGKVIGINTAILAPNGGNIGIGFAIPSNIARRVIKQLRELGHTRRGWLGAAVQRVSKEIAESVGLEKASGALVAKVFDKSPAKKAGIERGDIILKFNGKDVKSSHYLPRIVGETEIGKEVPVVIWRNEKKISKKIKVGEFEKAIKEGLIDTKISKPKAKKGEAEGVEVMGMTLQSLDELNRRKYKLDDKVKGVVIVDFDPKSEALDYGLTPGDVIAEVDRSEVNTPEDVKKKFAEARKKGRKRALLLIHRKGELRFFTLSVDEEKDSGGKK